MINKNLILSTVFELYLPSLSSHQSHKLPNQWCNKLPKVKEEEEVSGIAQLTRVTTSTQPVVKTEETVGRRCLWNRKEQQGSDCATTVEGIRKRVGTITLVFVTVLLEAANRTKNKKKTIEKPSQPATEEEEIKSTGKWALHFHVVEKSIRTELFKAIR